MTTTYTRPSWAVRRVSAMLTRLMDLGVPLGSLRLLQGRRTIPVMLFRLDGHDWLVSIFGETGMGQDAPGDRCGSAAPGPSH
jgi:hypothetical protein